MSEVIHVRGEGGAVFPMQLPLSSHVKQRFDRGDLARVNPDGSAWTEPSAGDEPVRRGPGRPRKTPADQ